MAANKVPAEGDAMGRFGPNISVFSDIPSHHAKNKVALVILQK